MALRVLQRASIFIACTLPVIAQSAVPNDPSPASSTVAATSSAPGALAIAKTVDSAANSAIASTTAAVAPAATLEPAAAIPSDASTPGGFFARFIRAYRDDWHPVGPPEPDPPYRGDPAPVTTPPWPFTVWPMGGTVTIGQPYVISTPLMTAIYGGSNGDAWKKSRIQIYGWGNVGMNISSSHDGPFANSPASYAVIANSIQPDQMTLYIERQPDTVQTDHFDWGFRFTNLWGLDYRFTTQKGVFSQQLLTPQANGALGQKYGYDPVMAYLDLYFPKVAKGLNVRIGRYVSLPDIEAQLAPNNYTYTHSLLYTYDCYTQDGINGTLKLGDHWTLQVGLSAGCDAAPWTSDAKLTGNVCFSFNWHHGADNFYNCANSINDGRYAYNNLAAYYTTWYHKINANWHTDTEAWYQSESHTPNVNNPAAASLLEPGANGAYCNRASELTCFAPEWAILNYVNRQMGKKNFISIRNEFVDDLKGQRTGFKTRYTEQTVSWNHWIGTTVLLRPEIRFEHAFDAPAYDSGNRHSQLMFSGDIIWFY
jgi:hypothetical protein